MKQENAFSTPATSSIPLRVIHTLRLSFAIVVSSIKNKLPGLRAVQHQGEKWVSFLCTTAKHRVAHTKGGMASITTRRIASVAARKATIGRPSGVLQ